MPVVEHANNVFKQHHISNREISVDESLFAPKNHSWLTKYLPKKRHHRCGIKLYILCDSVTSYLIFLQREEYRARKGMNDDRVVMKLLTMGNLPKKGYRLFVDNVFTSMPLIRELATHKIHLTGTVRHYRKETSKVVKAKLQPG